MDQRLVFLEREEDHIQMIFTTSPQIIINLFKVLMNLHKMDYPNSTTGMAQEKNVILSILYSLHLTK